MWETEEERITRLALADPCFAELTADEQGPVIASALQLVKGMTSYDDWPDEIVTDVLKGLLDADPPAGDEDEDDDGPVMLVEVTFELDRAELIALLIRGTISSLDYLDPEELMERLPFPELSAREVIQTIRNELRANGESSAVPEFSNELADDGDWGYDRTGDAFEWADRHIARLGVGPAQ